jgi:PAS domain S-box-containing protein
VRECARQCYALVLPRGSASRLKGALVELSSRLSVGGTGGLELLSEDSELVLCRGWHEGAGGRRKDVLILFPASEQPTPATLDRLAHEYSLKGVLDSTWAARPLEVLRDHGRTVLVLEDPGGQLLSRVLGKPMDVESFLHLAIGVAAALARVHRQGLIHKDVKPANILYNTASGEVRLTGFGIASRLPREIQSLEPPEFISGTLAYMAPEQTGRMNRSIDSRSDLYSLGVTFYELLTGTLPFAATEPVEWVHCHIARLAHPPGERTSGIPEVLSSIVMKLLAKTAEERYQTAGGVEADLRRCLMESLSHGRVASFTLGAHDTPDRLLIAEKLYGREREIDSLLASFDRVVAQGTPELVLVSGYSGVGKSSLVNELHKALVPPRGLFAAGKFDQYKREIPYATLTQALQTLVRQILIQSDAEVSQWRLAILEAVGSNGQLMVNLIPEVEFLIGTQPPVPDLPPQDAQRQFHTVFRRFIGVFAHSEHPLVLFLDDLQWLDAATLDLLEDILTQRDITHLLLIGAYRDNEVGAAHPLLRTLDKIRRGGATVQDIALAPLSNDDLENMIVDSLHCTSRRARPLMQLVHEKTGGNPFFASQFIHTLEDEALLVLNHAEGQWAWDLDRINAKHYTENVVDLMVAKLHRLPVKTQGVLRLLACVGSGAEFALLGAVCQTTEAALHENLWEALRAGLVLRSEGAYTFQHDRIQEAAHSLIADDARAEIHLRIGRLFLAHTAADKREEIIFEIVNHLNRGVALVASSEEREHLAELNLVAGKRAKTSTAYTSALKYLIAGLELLTEDHWERRHTLIFQLELERSECEFLTGEPAVAAARLTRLSSRAVTMVEQSSVECLRVELYTSLNQIDRAVAVFLDYLRKMGVEWSPHPTQDEARREYEEVWSRLGGRTVESLIDLPLMSNPTSLATLDILTKAIAPAMFTDANLLSLIICRMVNLSIEQGNSDGSCVAYVFFSMVAGASFGNYEDGFQFGRVGYDLVQQPGLKRFQARIFMSFAQVVLPWTKPIRASLELLHRAFEIANEKGDLTYAAYSRQTLNESLLAAGDPLEDVQRQAEIGLEFAVKARFGIVIDIIRPQIELIRTLRGLTAKFGTFDGEQFEEHGFELHLGSDSRLAIAESRYWIRKLQARFFAGDYLAAVEASQRARRLLWISPLMIQAAEYHFYSALSIAASYGTSDLVRDQQQLEALTAHHKQLEVWARHCPENFENRAALVGAEIARIEGRNFDTMRLYEQAIRSARENGFVQNEGLAYEVAAQFYGARGFDTFADAYLRNARECYFRWGAHGKVRQLEAQYPQLALGNRRGGSPEAVSPDQQLDVAAVVKASQALSSEMLLPRLIERLMTIALQNAGADRGLLILPQKSDYRIEAEARADGEEIVVHYGDAASPAVPETIIRYVMRTLESVILDDAAKKNLFSEDPYFGLRRQRSILCLPLLRQGVLVGLLYLENALASHAFTPARIAVLELLAAQAAISLENTRLYSDLREREAKVRRLVDANIIGIFIVDLGGEIIEANDAFLRMLGHVREDLVSGRMRWTDLTPPEWRAGDAKRVEALRLMGTLQPVEKEYFHKDGSRVPVLVGLARFEETGNQAVGFVLDLTARKRAESELAHANRVATMGELTASIAHEVNQPLAALLTNAGTAMRWLAHQPPNLEKATPLIDRIISDGRRAAEIVSRIRDFSRKAPAQMADLEINETILEIMILARAAMSEHGVLVNMQLSEGLPSIRGDRVQLQQVILNLIMNAIEAMSELSEGSRELVISTREVEADGVLIAVSDSGPGLFEANRERVFEAFYTTKSSGLGMGLSICRSIVVAHGGRLWAASNEPRGTVFCIMLPIGEKLL